MHTLFLRDMLCVGTLVNLLTTFAAFMAASQGAPSWAAAAIHFAPLPYNIFLYAAIGRALPLWTWRQGQAALFVRRVLQLLAAWRA